MTGMKPEYAAAGEIWVCAACGNHDHDRTKVGDEYCYMNAVRCYERTLKTNPETGRVSQAYPVSPS